MEEATITMDDDELLSSSEYTSSSSIGEVDEDDLIGGPSRMIRFRMIREHMNLAGCDVQALELDVLHCVIACFIAHRCDTPMAPYQIRECSLLTDSWGIHRCIAGLELTPYFYRAGENCALASGHPYTKESTGNPSDLGEELDDQRVLRDTLEKLTERYALAVPPSVTTGAEYVLSSIRGWLGGGDISDWSPMSLEPDDEMEDGEYSDSGASEECSQSIIAPPFVETLKMPLDKIASGSAEFAASLASLSTAFDDTLRYVSQVREVDQKSMLSQREPQALECIVQYVQDALDERLADLRNILRTHVGYTQADVNGNCMICHSPPRGTAVLMCGHKICMGCLHNPSFPKDYQPFLATPAVKCPVCKREGIFVKLYV